MRFQVWKPPTFLLLFLCWTVIVTVTGFTEDELKIIKDFVADKYGIKKQHAYTIVFHANECKSLTKAVIDKALIGDKRKNVRDKVIPEEIYEGPRMTMASFRKIDETRNEHAEYRLLYPAAGSNISPVRNLLNKNPKGACALFFTLNSPCEAFCLKPNGPFNIIKQLDQFSEISNKAFVYEKVYEDPYGKTCCSDPLKEVNGKLELYRCNDQCHKCITNNVFNAVCLKKKTW